MNSYNFLFNSMVETIDSCIVTVGMGNVGEQNFVSHWFTFTPKNSQLQSSKHSIEIVLVYT